MSAGVALTALTALAATPAAATDMWFYHDADWVAPFSTDYTFTIAGGSGGDSSGK